MAPDTITTEPSTRVDCVHAAQCGGCPLIGLTYGEQLSQKRGRVVQAVSRYPSLELTYTHPVETATPVTRYRTRAKLIVASGGRVGLYAKGGDHEVVNIPACHVLSAEVARVAERLRAMIAAAEASGDPLGPAGSGKGALRAVDIREAVTDAGPRVLITLVLDRALAPDPATLRLEAARIASSIGGVEGVAVNYRDADGPQILGNETVHMFGNAHVADRLGGSVHVATYGSFVQAHRPQTARIHARLADLCRTAGAASREPARVLDLYGGSGAIALSLAQSGANVHMVESFLPAVEAARTAARAQGLALFAESEDCATTLARLHDERARFDVVVANPPRRGMSPIARERLARLGPSTIAYVSCDPDTLARDLDHLAQLGYAVTLLQPLDMIPLTEEVETVAVLRRSTPATARIAWEDDEILIVEKPPHEPTTGDGPDAPGSLLARVRRHDRAERAIPLYRLDVGTSGLVALVRRPEDEKRWLEVFAASSMRRVFVAGARGVTSSKGAIVRDLREDGRLFFARTRYRRLAVASGHSVLRVIPEQGRTHQVRRHLAAIGHPLLGDSRYGHPPTNRFFEERNTLDRTFLHCVRLEIDHPGTGQRLIVESPLPGDLRVVLERTSGPGTLRFLDHKNALGTSSSLPPDPEAVPGRGSALDVDTSPRIRPELTSDDEG